MSDQNPPIPTPDMAFAIDVIQRSPSDVDIQVVKRDGKIVNIEVTENYRKQLEKHRLKEVI